MELFKKKVWIIVTKDRSLILKGASHKRLVRVGDNSDRNKIVTYTSKKVAENAMNNIWQWSCGLLGSQFTDDEKRERVEAVEVTISVTEN